MHLVRALFATAALLSLAMGTARADDADWAALAQRVAAHDPAGDLQASAGAEPPGYIFPLPERPALALLGSTWFAAKAGGQPLFVHLYYVPTSHTGTASEALFAQLRAAGYTNLDQPPPYPPPLRTQEPAQHMCPRDLRQPSIDVTIRQIDGLPALDLAITLHAESTLCRDAVLAPLLKARFPALTGIPDVVVHTRTSVPGLWTASPFITATVETSLAPRDAVAKFADRFSANGWSARTAIVNGETITQRFAYAAAMRNLEALIVFDRRGEGAYNLIVVLSDTGPAEAR